LLSFLIVFSSCKKDEADKELKITIGVLATVTGGGESTGESMLAALDIATEDIRQFFIDNDFNVSLDVVVIDTETDTIKALQGLQELDNQGIRFVLGPYSSASVKAIKDFADQNDILILSTSSVAASLAIAGDNIYRLISNDNFQGLAMSAMLMDDSIEMLIPVIRDDVWGNELLEITTSHYNGSRGMVMDPIKYNPTDQDFAAIALQLDNNVNTALASYDANKIGVYVLSFGEGTNIIHESYQYTALKDVKWYGSSAYAENKSLSLDEDAANMALLTGLPCPIFGLPMDAKENWEGLSNQIANEIGRKPEVYALVAYDALWLASLTYLMTNDDNVSFETLKASFEFTAENYFGVTGATWLDDTGDRSGSSYDFWALEKPENDFIWEIVATYNVASGELEWY